MKIIQGNAQHIGNRRDQQDDFGFSDMEDAEFTAHGGVIAVLADGMGGMAMGKEAGRTGVRTMLKTYGAKLPEETISQALKRALLRANQAVFDMADAQGLAEDAGATLIAAVIYQEMLCWISVGDSRI